jgi:hypothetical protein
MKRPFLFALIFTEIAVVGGAVASAEPCIRRRVWAEPVRERITIEPVGERVVVQRIRRETGPLPIIAARASRASLARPKTEVEGVLPRALTSPDPVQMINPLAPLEYGSAWSFVIFTEREPYRTDNPNKNHLQTNGIRFLTIRPLW